MGQLNYQILAGHAGNFPTYLMLILFFRFIKTKKGAVFVPLLPLSFVVGYQADMAWGGKMERIVGE